MPGRAAVVITEPRDDAEAGVGEQGDQLVSTIQAHAFLKPATLIPQLDLLDDEAVCAVDTATHQHIAALGLLDHFERTADVLRVEIVEHEMTTRRERRSHLTDDPSVLLFAQKVTERGEQIDCQRETAGAKRQRPHVPPHQSAATPLPRASQHGARQIEPHHLAAPARELRGVASRPAGEIENAVARPPGHDAADQRDGAARVLIVAMWIEGMIFLAEPLLEPLGHSTKTSAENVKTRVAGSRQLPGASPAL